MIILCSKNERVLLWFVAYIKTILCEILKIHCRTPALGGHLPSDDVWNVRHSQHVSEWIKVSWGVGESLVSRLNERAHPSDSTAEETTLFLGKKYYSIRIKWRDRDAILGLHNDSGYWVYAENACLFNHC